MGEKRSWSRLLRMRTLSLAGVLAVALAAGELVADHATHIHLNVSIVYSLPLVVAAVARSRRLLWSLTAVLGTATFAVYSVQIEPGAFGLNEPYFVNRVLSAVTPLLCAGLLHAWMGTLDALDAQRRALRERNLQLESLNRELLAREDSIAHRNEELERRRVVAEEETNRTSQLLASMSHDIRTPVHAIRLLAEVIGKTADDPVMAPKLPGMAHRLEANARSLTDLLSDVLDMVRIDAGRIELHKSTFSLNELLAEQQRGMLPLAQARRLELRVAQPEPEIWLATDRQKLGRVLANLVGNAIKFTREGEVALEAMLTEERALLLVVRDTGIGIAAEKIERIFEEFARLSDGDGAGGWGMGLAICRRFASALGGTISVVSRPGEGSAFTLRLASGCLAACPDAARPQAAVAH